LIGDALHNDLLAAYGRRLAHRRRRRVVAAVASAAGLALAGAGFGAAALFGWPAPQHVKDEIAAVDRGLPADLRLNPDVEHARAVAATDTATLYAASLRDGGSCTEIVTPGERGRGATCVTGAQAGNRPLDVVMPFDDEAGPDSPVVVGGRVNAEAGASLRVHYADGSSDEISLGDDRYFLFDVPTAKRATVHASGLELVAQDEHGVVVGRATVPPTGTTPPSRTRSRPCSSAPGPTSPTSRRSTGSKGTSARPGQHGSSSYTATAGERRSRSSGTEAMTTPSRPAGSAISCSR